MRQRLQAFLPIMLIALMVQILAPIGIAWAAAAAASDPFRVLEICHSQPGSDSSDDESRARLGQGCTLCCVSQAAASVDAPSSPGVVLPYRAARPVIWHDQVFSRFASRAGSNTRARAPPLTM
ncbi:DUF2946 family protein [Bradyrhizobium sp. STM 3809]|uniref:DUF2946 family protein n=1 Tax=Bradyrhizobium sp. STM 3809 TaxID=551936 RepID=UPI0002409437|nr:DUF2946 family protein [Bradyrhizobium sp. STM 3809]CCE01979.1 conserved exported hypothetical protein [Bradyrhizobium sp. STM 3809]